MKNLLSEIDFTLTLLALMVAVGTMGVLGVPVFFAGVIGLGAADHLLKKTKD
jgi:hypothetical protein